MNFGGQDQVNALMNPNRGNDQGENYRPIYDVTNRAESLYGRNQHYTNDGHKLLPDAFDDTPALTDYSLWMYHIYNRKGMVFLDAVCKIHELKNPNNTFEVVVEKYRVSLFDRTSEEAPARTLSSSMRVEKYTTKRMNLGIKYNVEFNKTPKGKMDMVAKVEQVVNSWQNTLLHEAIRILISPTISPSIQSLSTVKATGGRYNICNVLHDRARMFNVLRRPGGYSTLQQYISRLLEVRETSLSVDGEPNLFIVPKGTKRLLHDADIITNTATMYLRGSKGVSERDDLKASEFTTQMKADSTKMIEVPDLLIPNKNGVHSPFKHQSVIGEYFVLPADYAFSSTVSRGYANMGRSSRCQRLSVFDGATNQYESISIIDAFRYSGFLTNMNGVWRPNQYLRSLISKNNVKKNDNRQPLDREDRPLDSHQQFVRYLKDHKIHHCYESIEFGRDRNVMLFKDLLDADLVEEQEHPNRAAADPVEEEEEEDDGAEEVAINNQPDAGDEDAAGVANLLDVVLDVMHEDHNQRCVLKLVRILADHQIVVPFNAMFMRPRMTYTCSGAVAIRGHGETLNLFQGFFMEMSGQNPTIGTGSITYSARLGGAITNKDSHVILGSIIVENATGGTGTMFLDPTNREHRKIIQNGSDMSEIKESMIAVLLPVGEWPGKNERVISATGQWPHSLSQMCSMQQKNKPRKNQAAQGADKAHYSTAESVNNIWNFGGDNNIPDRAFECFTSSPMNTILFAGHAFYPVVDRATRSVKEKAFEAKAHGHNSHSDPEDRNEQRYGYTPLDQTRAKNMSAPNVSCDVFGYN